jgi:prepilin-type N-terminal cleavage/methylation domain-containing protein
MAIQSRVEPTGSRVAKKGFSLTELLVASAIGLAVMGAVATLLSTIGSTTRNAEAIVAMTDGLRTASAKLRDDLTGITADVRLRPCVQRADASGRHRRHPALHDSGSWQALRWAVYDRRRQRPSSGFVFRVALCRSGVVLQGGAGC